MEKTEIEGRIDPTLNNRPEERGPISTSKQQPKEKYRIPEGWTPPPSISNEVIVYLIQSRPTG
jgi:hypothetical protein